LYIASLNFQAIHHDIANIPEGYNMWGHLLDLAHRAERFEDIVDLNTFGITMFTDGKLNDSFNWVIDDLI
jgi:hypothetical protein